MKRLLVMVAVLELCISWQVRAIEPEPNWDARLDEITKAIAAQFKSPKVGERISIDRRVGGEFNGRVGALTDSSITLDGKEFLVSQLTPESADRIFATVHASKVAKTIVKDDRAEYDFRRQDEIRQQQEDAQRLEAQRQVSVAEDIRQRHQTEAANEVLERQRDAAEAERDRIVAASARQQQGREAAARAVFLIVALCLIALPLYILPSIIAFKRGHPNAGAICALNILLGWSIFGWVASLVWALTQQAVPNVTVNVNNAPAAQSCGESRGKKIIVKKRP